MCFVCVWFMSFLLACVTFAEGRSQSDCRELELRGEYLDFIADYYASVHSFTTSPEELERLALRIKLFACEAIEKGLQPADIDFSVLETKKGVAGDERFLSDISLAESFIRHVADTYVVDSLVIESYYHSLPERFRDGPWSGADIMPLDDELRETIRRIIFGSVRERIMRDIFNELKAKYGVHVCE